MDFDRLIEAADRVSLNVVGRRVRYHKTNGERIELTVVRNDDVEVVINDGTSIEKATVYDIPKVAAGGVHIGDVIQDQGVFYVVKMPVADDGHIVSAPVTVRRDG